MCKRGENMKKSLFLFGVIVMAAAPVLAGVDVKTTTEPYYIRNQHYSEEANRLIQLNKAYANGVPVHQKKQKATKAGEVVDTVFKYVDPGWDDNKFFVRDMPQQPGFSDL